MTMRKIFLIVLALGLVAGFAALRTNRTDEPRFQGKSLTEWLAEDAADEKSLGYRTMAPKFAIRQIGTNGIPTLLSLMTYNPGPISRLYWSLPRQARQNRTLLGPMWRENILPNRAADALVSLGPGAALAVPGLVKIASESTGLPATRAIVTLARLGPSGAKGLAAIANDTNHPMHIAAASFIQSRSNSVPAQ